MGNCGSWQTRIRKSPINLHADLQRSVSWLELQADLVLVLGVISYPGTVFAATRALTLGNFHCTLGMGLRARSRVRNLGFLSPIPQIVCVESDAEKIGRKESELRRSHPDDTDDDAVCSRNEPALP